ncbi:MAG: glycosyltransferase family 8 protein [Clostridiales bacterium]|jgi:lipopolysaccharide biosynthesis glycosyltransferase|nr:glycosyltransferase family 8 protein [Clostridiales bacterium]
MCIPIVLTFNSGFVKQATVVMYSALKNAKVTTKYHFYLFSYDLTSDDLQFIKNALSIFEQKFTIEHVMIGTQDYENIPLIGWYGKETNFRLLAPKLLPHVEKFLYLDCDILVLDDLCDLFETDITDKAYAACSEKRQFQWFLNPVANMQFYNRFKFFDLVGIDIMDEHTHYTNSGVMLINNKYWIEKRYTDRAFDFIYKYKANECYNYPDQEALNVLAIQDGLDSRVYLSWKYNIMRDFSQLDCTNPHTKIIIRSLYLENDISNEFVPVIIHFTDGLPKPWRFDKKNMHYVDLYYEYAKLINWDIRNNIKYLEHGKFYTRKEVRFKKLFKKSIKAIMPYGLLKLYRKFKNK